MKVYLETQEWGPVHWLFQNENDTLSDAIIEVPEELYNDYEKAGKAFYEIQKKISEIVDGNSKSNQ